MRISRGFTLIELMVVLAIVAILASLSAPSFARLIQSTVISGNVNNFLGDMRYARSESIRRGGGVVLCRSDAPEAANPACSDAGSNTNGWVSGWIIFHDIDHDGARGNADTLLRVQAPITSINAIKDGANGYAKFRFTATGRLLNLTATTPLVFGASPQFDSATQRAVCISLGGGTRIAGDGAASC